MSKSVDDRVKSHIKDGFANALENITDRIPMKPPVLGKATERNAALYTYREGLERPESQKTGHPFSGLGFDKMHDAKLEDFYLKNYCANSIFSRIGIISSFIPSSITSPYETNSKLYWEAFPLHKRKAIAIAYDPDIEKFRYHEAEGLVLKYTEGYTWAFSGDSCTTEDVPAKYEGHSKKSLLEKLTVTKEADDWVMIAGTEKTFDSLEELKEQFLDDIAKGIAYHVSRTPSRLAKVFSALTLAGGILYACATDAAEFPAQEDTIKAPPETSISFEPQ